jgi:hypothetical protein
MRAGDDLDEAFAWKEERTLPLQDVDLTGSSGIRIPRKSELVPLVY